MKASLAVVPPARKLRDLSGVGVSIEANLRLLGIASVADLAASDADNLYIKLAQVEGRPQDPCVLDTFRCAIAQARNPDLTLEQRNWWWWSRQRKLGAIPAAPQA